MRAVLVLLGLGLTLVGVEATDARTLPWIDVALGLCVLVVGVAGSPEREPRRATVALGGATLGAGVGGLVSGAGAWLAIWTVAFGVAILLASRARAAPAIRP